MRDQTGESELTNKFELYIIILPRVEKCLAKAEQDNLVDWCKFLLNPYSEEVEDIIMINKDIKSAKEELEILNGDYEIQRLAELREKAIRDEAAALDFAINKGLKQGIEQGIEQGKQQLIKTAKKLLEMGLSIDEVSKVTELTKEEVEKLK